MENDIDKVDTVPTVDIVHPPDSVNVDNVEEADAVPISRNTDPAPAATDPAQTDDNPPPNDVEPKIPFAIGNNGIPNLRRYFAYVWICH